jgi:hypothetical protein
MRNANAAKRGRGHAETRDGSGTRCRLANKRRSAFVDNLCSDVDWDYSPFAFVGVGASGCSRKLDFSLL